MAWRWLFASACAFNLAIGIGLLLAPVPAALAAGFDASGSDLFIRTAGLLIAVMGIGYAMAAHDPPRNRVILWLGVIGKPLAASLLAFYFAAGAIPLRAFVLGLGDLGFAALFTLYLLRTKAA